MESEVFEFFFIQTSFWLWQRRLVVLVEVGVVPSPLRHRHKGRRHLLLVSGDVVYRRVEPVVLDVLHSVLQHPVSPRDINLQQVGNQVLQFWRKVRRVFVLKKTNWLTEFRTQLKISKDFENWTPERTSSTDLLFVLKVVRKYFSLIKTSHQN